MQKEKLTSFEEKKEKGQRCIQKGPLDILASGVGLMVSEGTVL